MAQLSGGIWIPPSCLNRHWCFAEHIIMGFSLLHGLCQTWWQFRVFCRKVSLCPKNLVRCLKYVKVWIWSKVLSPLTGKLLISKEIKHSLEYSVWAYNIKGSRAEPWGTPKEQRELCHHRQFIIDFSNYYHTFSSSKKKVSMVKKKSYYEFLSDVTYSI